MGAQTVIAEMNHSILFFEGGVFFRLVFTEVASVIEQILYDTR